MPNYCSNEIKVNNVEAFKSNFCNDRGVFEFNKVIPMPDCLEGTAGTNYFEGADLTKSDEVLISEVSKTRGNVEDIELNLAALRETGHENWYTWRIENWGTKWDISDDDCSEFSTDGDMFFTTAWAPISLEMFNIIGTACDGATLKFFEPGCCFVGQYECVDGESSEIVYADGTEEYWEMVFEDGHLDKDEHYKTSEGGWFFLPDSAVYSEEIDAYLVCTDYNWSTDIDTYELTDDCEGISKKYTPVEIKDSDVNGFIAVIKEDGVDEPVTIKFTN